MKKRMLMLFVSLFALTPALLGTTAWGIENRSKNGTKQECELMEAKHYNAGHNGVVKDTVRKGSKTSIN